MRLDRTQGEPASVMVQRLREKELADIFWLYGEERYSRRVARKIVEVRKTAPLDDHACNWRSWCGLRAARPTATPSARPGHATFSRPCGSRSTMNWGPWKDCSRCCPIASSQEGRAGIISFHSLEDRLVKKSLSPARDV